MEEKCKQYLEGYNLGLKYGSIKSLRNMIESSVFPHIIHEERFKIVFQSVCVDLQEPIEFVDPTSEKDLEMYLFGYVNGKSRSKKNRR